jgi:hypothetical protein
MTNSRSISDAYLSRTAHSIVALLAILTLLAALASAQTTASSDLGDFSGLYTFLRDGESVQITLDQLPSAEKKEVPVSGYISRMGSSDSDKDQILDIWFKSGTTDGEHIRFTTKQIHGLSYEFSGRIHRGEAKSKEKEGYLVIDGTLTEHSVDGKGKEQSRTREITMKSFPALDGADQQ